MHLAGHTWAWWKHKLKKWGHIPWLSCKQLTCFSQGETGVQTWGASEKKQSMHFSLKPQNGLTTNTAADNQYYHTPGLLPERWIITSRSLHQLCVSEKPTLHFQLLEKFAYNRKKKKKKDQYISQPWFSSHCHQQKEPWCPPRAGVLPLESHEKVKPHGMVQISKLLSEPSWGHPQVSAKLVKK